jgi:hypothetical protein
VLFCAQQTTHERRQRCILIGEYIVARIFLCHASEDKAHPHNPRTRHKRRIV